MEEEKIRTVEKNCYSSWSRAKSLGFFFPHGKSEHLVILRVKMSVSYLILKMSSSILTFQWC